MNLRWLISKTVRTAAAMRKHVHKILCAQSDLLTPQAVSAVQAAVDDTKKAERSADTAALQKQMTALEETANKWLKPYPNAAIRENIEVLLVALAVALGIRTFFLQPFKIPTGSMQPTLFGVTPPPIDRKVSSAPVNGEDVKIPDPFSRFLDFWIYGDSYYNLVAPADGRLEAIKPPSRLLLFNLKEQYKFAGTWHTVWFPADDLFQRVGYRVGTDGEVLNCRDLKSGESIVKLEVHAGDHLFVDRLSYNFRHPKRGEIVVFETKGIPADRRAPWDIPPDEFYIKRLVALGGEQVQIGDDRHLIINGRRLDTNSDWPHFVNVYGFGTNPPSESHFSGHVLNPGGYEVPVFASGHAVTVEPGHYMVMGDNTMNSLDSRYWGDFPAEYVIGKYLLVYWPFTARFGWSAK